MGGQFFAPFPRQVDFYVHFYVFPLICYHSLLKRMTILYLDLINLKTGRHVLEVADLGPLRKTSSEI